MRAVRCALPVLAATCVLAAVGCDTSHNVAPQRETVTAPPEDEESFMALDKATPFDLYMR